MRATGDASPARYFKPRRLGHVNLWVADLDASERFYHECCGLTVEFTEPDLIATFLGTGHTPHDLGMIKKTDGVDRYGRNGLLQLPGSIGREVGLNHLAWELENEAELVAAFKHLQADRIETHLTVDHQVAHSVYMFDPDGNYNEFYCDTVTNWRAVLHGAMDLITSSWDPLAAEPSTEARYDTAPTLRTVPSAPLHPRRVTHAVLQTADLPGLRDFYTRIGGLSVVDEDDGAIYLGGSHPDYPYNLVLVEGAAPAYGHVAFELADEGALDAATAALARSGAKVEQTVSLPWKRALFLRDPDGLLSEWYVRRTAPRRLATRGEVPRLRAA
jgi:catechol 2,3-dioxygenase